MREVCRATSSRFRGAIRRRARARSISTPRAHLVDPLPYAVGKYRSRAVPRQRSSDAARHGRRSTLVVCDFLSPAVNLPRGCPARPCSSRTTSKPRSGGGMRRRSNPVARVPAHAAVAAHAALRERGARAGSTACSPCRTPIARRSQRLYPGRAARRRFTSCRPASTRRSSRPPRRPSAGSRARWSSPGRWTGCRTRTRCCIFCRDILPLIRAAEPDATLAIVGRAPTPAVRRLADEPGVDGHRAASTTCGRTSRDGGGLRRAAAHRRRHAAEDFRGDGDGQGGRLDDGRRRRAAGRRTASTSLHRRRARARSRARWSRLLRDPERARGSSSRRRARSSSSATTGRRWPAISKRRLRDSRRAASRRRAAATGRAHRGRRPTDDSRG